MVRSLLLVPITLVALVGCAPTAPAPAQAPPAGSSSGGWQAEMLASVNAQRAGAGRAPLRACASLERAARAHSADQAARTTMSHTGGNGSTLRQRAEANGYVGWSGLAENVAAGQPDVGRVMSAWMASPGHRANLVSSSYEHLGVGMARSASGTPYWTQVFGRSGSC